MKKAQGFHNYILLGMIIAIFILIVHLKFLSGVGGYMVRLPENTKCEKSVRIASLTKEPITGHTSAGIQCPLRNASIKKRGKDDKERITNALDDTLYYEYLCAKQLGLIEGEVKYNPFSQWGTESICVVCFELEYDDYLKGIGRLTKDEVTHNTRMIEAEIPGSDITYYQFFTGTIPSKRVKDEIKTFKEIPIDASKKQFVVYIVTMDTSMEHFASWVLGGAAVGGGTAAAGATTAAMISLIPGINVGFWTVLGAGIMAGGLAGAVEGGVVGSMRRDIATGSVIVVPKEDRPLQLNCHKLGAEPFNNPFEKEIKI